MENSSVLPLKRPTLILVSKFCFVAAICLSAYLFGSFGFGSFDNIFEISKLIFNPKQFEILILSAFGTALVIWLVSLLIERFVVAPKSGTLSPRNKFELISCLLVLVSPLLCVAPFFLISGFCLLSGSQVGCGFIGVLMFGLLFFVGPALGFLGFLGLVVSLFRIR